MKGKKLNFPTASFDTCLLLSRSSNIKRIDNDQLCYDNWVKREARCDAKTLGMSATECLFVIAEVETV